VRKHLEQKYTKDLVAQTADVKKIADEQVIKAKTEAMKERTAMLLRMKELERQLEKSRSHELGDGAERDLFDRLRESFPEDVIHRVAKGDNGPYVVQRVMSRAENCGFIIYESKNSLVFRKEYVAKIKEDKARLDATHAVLVSTSFPSGKKELCVEDGVIVVSHRCVIVVAMLLRDHMVTLHRQGLSMKQRTTKMDALYRYLTSGDFVQKLGEAGDLVDEIRDVDRKEKDSHQKVWATRERILLRLKSHLTEIDNRINAIIGGTAQSEAATDGNGVDKVA